MHLKLINSVIEVLLRSFYCNCTFVTMFCFVLNPFMHCDCLFNAVFLFMHGVLDGSTSGTTFYYNICVLYFIVFA